MTDSVTPEQLVYLTGAGDCPLHYHLEDRIPTHSTLSGLQSVANAVEIASDASVGYNVDYILVDTSSAAVEVSLPPAKAGKEFEVILVASGNDLTVTPSGTDTINGEPDMLLSVRWTAIRLKAITGGWVAV